MSNSPPPYPGINIGQAPGFQPPVGGYSPNAGYPPTGQYPPNAGYPPAGGYPPNPPSYPGTQGYPAAASAGPYPGSSAPTASAPPANAFNGEYQIYCNFLVLHAILHWFMYIDAKAAEAAQSAYYDPNRPQMAYVPPPAYYVSIYWIIIFLTFNVLTFFYYN